MAGFEGMGLKALRVDDVQCFMFKARFSIEVDDIIPRNAVEL
jgi:hypothetical protein